MTRQQARAARQLSRRSTWMVNIGTHRKPHDEEEYTLYAQSLRTAVDAVFSRPEWASDLLYPIAQQPHTSGRRTFLEFTDDFMRGNQFLQVRESVYRMVVERGAKQGRIDGHLILDIEHGPSLVRFDHNSFARRLQEELMIENQRMQDAGLLQRAPGKQHEPMAWPVNGRPYVSFRTIVKMSVAASIRYMTKQWDMADQQERSAFEQLRGEVEDVTGFQR